MSVPSLGIFRLLAVELPGHAQHAARIDLELMAREPAVLERCHDVVEVPLAAGHEEIAARSGNATGIYPMDSPGGWQLMGLTPVKTFDPSREVPILLNAGEYIRFIPIDEAEFKRIRAEVEAGTYQVIVHEGKEES